MPILLLCLTGGMLFVDDMRIIVYKGVHTMLTKKNLKKIIIFTLIIAFVVLMINVLQIPKLIECEKLTSKYGHEFTDPDVYETSVWITDVNFVKVLEYSKFKATVYYVQGDFDYGSIADLVRRKGEKWRVVYDGIVWSAHGNADGVVMPYWWHNIPG